MFLEEECGDDNDEEIRRQLAEMEQKMRQMKEKLKKPKDTEKAKPISSQRDEKKNMVEVDLFSSPGTNAAGDKKLKSPVKTQPLKVMSFSRRVFIFATR